MISQNHACPVCGCAEPDKYFDDRFECGGLADGSECHAAPDLAISRAKRITQLEAGLDNIKKLRDAPYAMPGTPGEALADSILEWAVIEAEAALKESP